MRRRNKSMSTRKTTAAGQTQYDVAVVGAGAAGIAAALGAAATGADTVLIEAEARIGGNITNALVHTICGLYHPLADSESLVNLRYANEGLPRRLAEALLAAGIATPAQRAGRVAFLPIDPLGFAEFATRLCTQTSKLDLMTQSPLQGAALSTQKSVAHELRFDGSTIAANVVIDASGDAVLAALGGAESMTEKESTLQTTSYTVEISDVDCEALSAHALGTLKLSAAIARAAKHGQLPVEAESVHFRRAKNPRSLYLNLNLPRTLTHSTLLRTRTSNATRTLDPQAAALRDNSLLLRAQTLTASVLDFLQRSEAAFSKSRLTVHPTQIGVRETRRLRGLEILAEDALLDGLRRSDEVALSAWPIELWQDHRRASFLYPRSACSIPLSALVSRSHPLLGMAGRCMSATHEALGAVRVIGTALATGEAIGIAAALAAKSDHTLAAIDPAQIRAHIEQHAQEQLQA